MRSRGGGGGDLPAEVTSFVGRRRELGDVRTLLSNGRLVTLTGPGGVGKTRLALRAARDVARAFPDGVHLVELGALTDASLLAHTVTDALGLRDQSARPAESVLRDYLKNRRLLLVLDNCEHIVAAVAKLATTLLREAAELRILATSRQALHIDGEHLFTVPPLAVPPVEGPAPTSTARYSALELFEQRAKAILPGFEVSTGNRDDAVRLCQRLEGLPLAIELATVRLRALSLAEIVERLDDRFRLLSQGNRSAPSRHQTLQAAVEWSYELCDPLEQLLWARASIFAGSFEIAGAEEVCSGGALVRSQVLDALTGLVEKSILIREEAADRARFRMLEVIREYGRAKLRESGVDADVGARHCDFYAALIDRAATEWFGPQQREWSDRLRLDHGDLRQALEFSLSQREAFETGLRVVGTAWFLWLACGRLTEGRHWLTRATKQTTEPSHHRAWALGTLAYVALVQGDIDTGAASFAECRDIAGLIGDTAALAYATHMEGVRAMISDDLSQAIELLNLAQSRYRAADVLDDYPWGMRIQLGTTHLLHNDLDRAAEVADAVQQHCEERGESFMRSYALWDQSLIALLRDNDSLANTLASECLRVKRDLHDTLGLALALDLSAWIAAASGRAERAAVLLGGASEMWETFGEQLFDSKHFKVHRERCEEQTQQMLDTNTYGASRRRGAEMSVDELVTYALDERTTSDASRQRHNPLTRRERQVAQLVSAGMTNKDIAGELVISYRTVEAHVDHILNKLGFSSRTQIATWVAEMSQAEDGSTTIP